MRKESLLELDLQMFAEDEVSEAGENDLDTADQGESDEETTEDESSETVEEESGNDEPQEQSAEVNAQFAAMRRRAEAEAQKKYAPIIDQLAQMNQQAAAMCEGITNPVTGQPITNLFEYWQALTAQQQQNAERQLQDNGVDPSLIKKMVASDPTVLQAQAVMQQMQMNQANAQILKDIEEIGKIDPNIKSKEDLMNAPYKDALIDYCQKHGTTLIDAYKVLNFDHTLQHQSEAARQQAINQMRGKSHLNSQSTGVAQEDDYVEVPADIMARWKEEGKTEKQIRALYKSVAKKLHIS